VTRCREATSFYDNRVVSPESELANKQGLASRRGLLTFPPRVRAGCDGSGPAPPSGGPTARSSPRVTRCVSGERCKRPIIQPWRSGPIFRWRHECRS
jgi:hypothetical protein